jgi:hypothetical protein
MTKRGFVDVMVVRSLLASINNQQGVVVFVLLPAVMMPVLMPM